MNEQIEQLMYRAGLTSQGCWDELDDYTKQSIEKFAELLVCECSGVIQDFVTMRVPASQYPGLLKKYFGVQR